MRLLRRRPEVVEEPAYDTRPWYGPIQLRDDPPMELWRDAGTGLLWARPRPHPDLNLFFEREELCWCISHAEWIDVRPIQRGTARWYTRAQHWRIVAQIAGAERDLWGGTQWGTSAELERLRQHMRGEAVA